MTAAHPQVCWACFSEEPSRSGLRRKNECPDSTRNTGQACVSILALLQKEGQCQKCVFGRVTQMGPFFHDDQKNTYVLNRCFVQSTDLLHMRLFCCDSIFTPLPLSLPATILASARGMIKPGGLLHAAVGVNKQFWRPVFLVPNVSSKELPSNFISRFECGMPAFFG